MNSAFVLCAYFAMVLSPCFVATYGDLLSVRWLFALVRRRRTHRAESFRVSVRYERYAMAVALEATFACQQSEYFASPKPFLVPQRSAPMENPAFIEARQRVAARLAQLAVAHKLRSVSGIAEKVVTLPADVAAMADPIGLHIRPRKPEPLAAPTLVRQMRAERAHLPTHLVLRDSALPNVPSAPAPRELVEVARSLPVRAAQATEASPPLRKPGESDALERAA